jgi:hypothetical protein
MVAKDNLCVKAGQRRLWDHRSVHVLVCTDEAERSALQQPGKKLTTDGTENTDKGDSMLSSESKSPDVRSGFIRGFRAISGQVLQLHEP